MTTDVLLAAYPEKRIVIKIGSALLVENGQVRQAWLDALVDEIAVLRGAGKQVLIVSSGSIAVGRTHLGLTAEKISLAEKQASAATGQIALAHAYHQALARHCITAGQILITLSDTEERRRYLNATDTLNALLRLGVVPIINENDTVATSEIRYGDNDRLSARIATMIEAELLLLMSDVDGLYSADPRTNPDAKHFPEIVDISDEIEGMAGDPPPGYSSGGMKTKLTAAKLAVAAGTDMMILDGRENSPLTSVATADKKSTRFVAQDQTKTAKKAWISGHLNPRGDLVLDAGAVRALGMGKSLLPSGIIKINGTFQRGDCVRILDEQGKELARGLIAYDVDEAQKIRGRQSAQIETVLGYSRRDEMVHRDHMVLV
ncbi:MAG: glutamate 5-kinase [Alphaproteobacteria bacterium]